MYMFALLPNRRLSLNLISMSSSCTCCAVNTFCSMNDKCLAVLAIGSYSSTQLSQWKPHSYSSTLPSQHKPSRVIRKLAYLTQILQKKNYYAETSVCLSVKHPRKNEALLSHLWLFQSAPNQKQTMLVDGVQGNNCKDGKPHTCGAEENHSLNKSLKLHV